jgi:tetratricopeptide (TPR) repeat protein/tRNA A-37 threonylcarbamoyl transferase component Bud32
MIERVDPTTWTRVREIIEAALERPEAEREAFLADACGEDAELAREVRSLVGLERSEAAWLEAPDEAFARRTGQRVGAWELEGEIGAGGMGTVYAAHRADREFEKRVAVKVLKRGLDTDDMLVRFRRERQVLAGLEHPGIARLIDGGATPDGRPFLVMELVDGEPIDAWCDARQLPLSERVQVFIEVCEAVTHAHGNLVVHSDLKPSNVLVNTEGRPKLLDFGLAKVLSPSGSNATRTITGGSRFLTPDYASPEQVRGESLTTASDVYSLGAVLYRLLTGQKPHPITTNSPLEIERAVCLTEPKRPSEAVADSSLKSALSGDLDSIVLAALRKEPERRYASAARLSEDLQRYLDGRPVLARPDSLGYRLGKFVTRHKVPVGASAALLLVVGGATWNNVRLEHLAQTAVLGKESERASRVDEIRRLAAEARSIEGRLSVVPGTVALREELVLGITARLDALVADVGASPELLLDLARVYLTLGDVQGHPYRPSLGRPELAVESYALAEDFLEQAAAADTEDRGELTGLRVWLLTAQARVANWRGRHRESIERYEEATATYEELKRENPALHVPAGLGYGHAEVLFILGRDDEALEVLRRSQFRSREHWTTTPTWNNAVELVTVLLAEGSKQADLGDFERGEAILLEALEVLQEIGSEAHELDWMGLAASAESYLGRILTRANLADPAGAEYLDSARARFEELVSRDPEDIRTRRLRAQLLHGIGDRKIRLGEYEDALEVLRLAENEWELLPLDAAEENRRELAVVRDWIGKSLYRLGRHEEAIETLELVGTYFRERAARAPDSMRDRRDLAVNLYQLAWPTLEQVQEDAPAAERAAAVRAALRHFEECQQILEELDTEGLLLDTDRPQMAHLAEVLDELEEQALELESSG